MGTQPSRAILVIDDFVPFTKLIRHALTQQGFEVFAATSPQEGLSQFQNHQKQIELVVIDMVKPAAGNLDLTAELERLRPGLPALYLVGARKSTVRSSIQASAASAVMVVPFNEEQFIKRVLDILEAHATPHPIPDEEFWGRLLETSDRLPPATVILCIYPSRQSAAVAARHLAYLRASRVRYAFRPTNCVAAPYAMVVAAEDFGLARSIIAQPALAGALIPAA